MKGEERKMELSEEDWHAEEGYLGAFDNLIGDERTRRTFRGVVAGIIGGESLRTSVIARFSPRVCDHQTC